MSSQQALQPKEQALSSKSRIHCIISKKKKEDNLVRYTHIFPIVCLTTGKLIVHTLYNIMHKSILCKAPAKRSQHVNATYRNIVGRNMLCSFGHHVAMCCDMLGVVGSSLKMVKFGPTTPNTSQHVATGWPNARNMLRPTMLRYVVLACCDRLAGA